MSSKRSIGVVLAAGLGLVVGLFFLWWFQYDTQDRQVADVSEGVDGTTPASSSSPLPRKAAHQARPKLTPTPASPTFPSSPAATASVRFERAQHEWQGMIPESNEVWLCPENAVGCGMARACVEGLCTPCVADDECLGAELCVLGVCMREELVGCRSAADCRADQVCMLSGFTALDARSNRDLKSQCVRDHWREDAENDVAAQRERRIKDQADLAYQNSTTKRGLPAAYRVTPSGELAAKSLRSVLSPESTAQPPP